jgi:glycerol-3-phosphate dehydrogenase subunit C
MRPTRPPVFDPNDPRFWDERDLEEELERVFSICHGCRMCVGYCPAFPKMFERVDGYVATRKGEVDAFDDADYRAVNDLCYQCKICYFKCPYTPDDGHPFMVDFPRLMLRHRAQRAKRDGVTFQDRVLGEPQVLGLLGSGPAAPMANLVTKNRLLRKVQEAVTGISTEFNLPPFASKTAWKWWSEHRPLESAGERGEVALFATCTVSFNLPTAGAAAVQVLEKNGYAVHFPKDQTCCGMPNLDGGDVEASKAKARKNVEALYPHAAKGQPILVPGPTCSYVLKKDYPELLGTKEATVVAEHTFDLMEWLFQLLKKDELDLGFERTLGSVGYHAPCHLRAQKIGFPAQRILRKVPETEVSIIQECSAVDGTWGMKAQHYDLGVAYADKLVNEMKGGGFDIVATDCPLSGLRLEKELGRPAVHPIELLNEAYGLPQVRPETLSRGDAKKETKEEASE